MKSKRVFLAVDAANLFGALENGARPNYRALLEFGQRLGSLVKAAIYVPRNSGTDREKGLLLALKHMGFTRVIARHLRYRPDGRGKSDLDTAIILDIWEAALRQEIDTVILASGDSDFVPLVERLVDQGLEVYVVGPDRATAWELIVAATYFTYTAEVEGFVPVDAAEVATLTANGAQ
ncbi:MAG TPA: hypothetical protein DEP84_10260 [Chloroflexi bacterium]|nr:hypothetical protein [Chloroflexota bacterium]